MERPCTRVLSIVAPRVSMSQRSAASASWYMVCSLGQRMATSAEYAASISRGSCLARSTSGAAVGGDARPSASGSSGSG